MRFSFFKWLLATTIIKPHKVLIPLGIIQLVLLGVTSYLLHSFWWGAVPTAMLLAGWFFGSLSTWSVLVEASIKRTGDHPDMFRFELGSYVRHLKKTKKDSDDE